MRRSRSRLALAAVALAAACHTRDVTTHPFHFSAVVVADGSPIEAGRTRDTYLPLLGTGRLEDPTTLVVGDATLGDVRITFDTRAVPGVRFPAALDGGALLVELFITPADVGPRLEPLPIVGIRVATGAPARPTFEFLASEWNRAADDGTPIRPVAFEPNVTFTEDVPIASPSAPLLEYEPARCGLVYYDLMSVAGDDRTLTLEPGDRGTVSVGARPEPWNVLHVTSWQRDGKCRGQSGTWTQIIAWR